MKLRYAAWNSQALCFIIGLIVTEFSCIWTDQNMQQFIHIKCIAKPIRVCRSKGWCPHSNSKIQMWYVIRRRCCSICRWHMWYETSTLIASPSNSALEPDCTSPLARMLIYWSNFSRSPNCQKIVGSLKPTVQSKMSFIFSLFSLVRLRIINLLSAFQTLRSHFSTFAFSAL